MPQYPDHWKDLRVGLCHDWLTGMRGGERVLEILCDGFPEAPIYTLIHHREAVSETINRHPIHSSWLQRVPGIFERYRYFLPFFPRAIKRFKTEPADLIVSSSHCVAKGIRKPEGARHLCYCFTPMRYAWLFRGEYFGNNKLKNAVLDRMRTWDRDTVDRVDHFVAISEHVRERIQSFYERDAEVVYPPANTEFFTPNDAPREEFDLIVSAMVPYKRVDLAVEAYSQSGFPLKVVGVGTGLEALKQQAKPNVEFLGRQPDDVLRELYRRCRCLVFPGEEDFGIVPVEAMACGCPVVAFRKGGATETVAEGVSGIFFDEQRPEALNEAVTRAGGHSWQEKAIRERSETFSVQRFIDGMSSAIDRCLQEGK